MINRLCVLLADDSEDDAFLIQRELRRTFADITLERVDTPEAFQSALARGTFDVVLSDHRMPCFSSTEALELLKASRMDVPFIIVSGTLGEEAAVGAMKAGASDYLSKSSLRRLAPAIAREVRDAEGRRARRRAEEALRALEIENTRALESSVDAGASLAHVVHELRTPLNAILGFSQILRDGRQGPLTDAQRESVTHIHESGRDLLRLIGDMLDHSKAESGGMTIAREPCDVARIVVEALATLHPLAVEREIELSLDPTTGALPAVSADPQRLKQVLYNLISNAIKFTADLGRVSVRCVLAIDRARVRIEINDNGAGISPEDQARLFVPFTQLANARGRGGTGLGLALTRKLTELMGGRIGLESSPGHGATFFVELPVHHGVTNGKAP